MPKILENIEAKIYDEAKILFYNNGYKNVDMKNIAQKCGIAVGTLYNYYPNKKTIFLKVLSESWENTFKCLNEIIINQNNKENSLENIISILYDHIRERKGIGINMKQEIGENDDNFIEIQEYIISSLSKIISKIISKKLYNEFNSIVKKITYTIITNIYILIEIDAENRDENIKFILYNNRKFI